jgi:hypothetical protein
MAQLYFGMRILILRKMFFISFSPGFNRVTTGYLISENRFNGYLSASEFENR